MDPATSATVTLLPITLALVHIPRSRLPQLTHQVVEQLLLPSPTFLNITCNQLELSIFADVQVVSSFEAVASKDRKRIRTRRKAEGKGSSSIIKELEKQCVQVSCEQWNVLQIDSHDQRVGNSGSRVRAIAEPLAAAGISILYQSSYQCDFIVVNTSRLHDVLSILAGTGSFSVYSEDPISHTSSMTPLVTCPPTDDSDDSEGNDIFTQLSIDGASTGEGYFRSRSGTRTSFDSLVLQASPQLNAAQSPYATPRSRAHSACGAQVTPLPTDLTCIGLPTTTSSVDRDQWSLKLVKLVAYPELILASTPTPKEKTDRDFVTPNFQSGTSTGGDIDGSLDLAVSQNQRDTFASESSSTSSDMDSDSFFTSPSPHRSSNCSSLPASQTKNASSTPSIPFFSITLTSEGSSLTTSLPVVCALFPKDERQQVICGDEVDIFEINQEQTSGTGRLTCLQIDLSKYGLDKHGLVNRFAQILDTNGIDHMYSSTYKTANLLVDKTHAARAAALLRSS